MRRCQYWLQGTAVELVARHAGQPCDDVRGTPPRQAVGYELGDCGDCRLRTVLAAPRCRCGDSNATAGWGQPASSSHKATSAFAPRGRNPRNWYRSAGNPLATSAVSTADAPGRTVTGTPASSAAATSLAPGSLIPGTPASLTSA